MLCGNLTKTIAGSLTNWDDKLWAALWAYRTVHKVTTQFIPFQLVYGQEAILPIEFDLSSLPIVIDNQSEEADSLQARLRVLEALDGTRWIAYLNNYVIQVQWKSYYDSKLKEKVFHIGDLVLLYDSRFFKFFGKLQTHWLGPYEVIDVNPNGSIQLKDFEGKILPTQINGY